MVNQLGFSKNQYRKKILKRPIWRQAPRAECLLRTEGAEHAAWSLRCPERPSPASAGAPPLWRSLRASQTPALQCLHRPPWLLKDTAVCGGPSVFNLKSYLSIGRAGSLSLHGLSSGRGKQGLPSALQGFSLRCFSCFGAWAPGTWAPDVAARAWLLLCTWAFLGWD